MRSGLTGPVPAYVLPQPWSPPEIGADDGPEIIVNTYKSILGGCIADGEAQEMEKAFAMGTASLLLSLIPFIGPVLGGVTGTVMDMYMGDGSDNCYKDKYNEYMQRFVYEAKSEKYIDLLQNHLLGYQKRIKFMIPEQKLDSLISLREDMIGDEPLFFDHGDHKRLAVIPARDYVNVRLALFLEEQTISDEDPAPSELQNMVVFIVNAVKYIKEAIHLAGKHMEQRVFDCRKKSGKGDGVKPGCTIDSSFRFCNCSDYGEFLSVSDCLDYWVYYVPGLLGAELECGHDGYKFISESEAKWRGYLEVVGDLNAGVPYDNWARIRDEFCSQMISPIPECSVAIVCDFCWDPNNPNGSAFVADDPMLRDA